MNSRKVLIFGVFDNIHEGHLSFIREAKEQGDHLVVVVARDSMVEKMKGKLPKYNEVDRIKNILEIPEVDLVLLGDLEMGTYNILKEVKPDIIFLGYDQESLGESLNKSIESGFLERVEIKYGTPYKPDTQHSSILNKKMA